MEPGLHGLPKVIGAMHLPGTLETITRQHSRRTGAPKNATHKKKDNLLLSPPAPSAPIPGHRVPLGIQHLGPPEVHRLLHRSDLPQVALSPVLVRPNGCPGSFGQALGCTFALQVKLSTDLTVWQLKHLITPWHPPSKYKAPPGVCVTQI